MQHICLKVCMSCEGYCLNILNFVQSLSKLLAYSVLPEVGEASRSR